MGKGGGKTRLGTGGRGGGGVEGMRDGKVSINCLLVGDGVMGWDSVYDISNNTFT